MRAGISKKRFEGWEPTTFYEYDDDTGRLVASWPETEWDAEQRGWVLALAEYEASRCRGGCGQNLTESQGEEVPGRYQALHRRCHACAALDVAQAAAAKDDAPGRLWYIEKVR